MLIFWLWIFSFIYKRKNFFTNKGYIRYHDVMTGPNNIYLQKMNIHPIQILGGKIILFFNKSIYLPRKKICFRPMIKVNLLWICCKKKKKEEIPIFKDVYDPTKIKIDVFSHWRRLNIIPNMLLLQMRNFGGKIPL